MIKKLIANLFNTNKQVYKQTEQYNEQQPKHALYSDYTFNNLGDYKVDMDKFNLLIGSQLRNIDTSNNPRLAMDSTSRDYSASMPWCEHNDNLLQKNIFPGFPFLSIISQIPIINNTINSYAENITRAGFKFISTDPDDAQDEIIAILKDRWKQFNCDKIINDANIITLGQGVSFIYPKLKDDDNKDENGRVELSRPLASISSATIAKGSLERFTVIEPQWCLPIEVNYTKPLTQDFYQPKKYTALGQVIDASRVIRMLFNELPNLVKPTYQFAGLSLTQKLIQSVRDFEEVKETIKEIIKRYNVSVITASEAVQADAQSMRARIKNFITGRNNFGVFLMSADEKFEQIQMQLAGLDDLVSRFAEFMCIYSQEPATKMLGISPRGFSTNDESGAQNFYDNIDSIRKNKIKPIMQQMINLILLNEGLELNNHIDIEFDNLQEPSALEKAQISQINASTDDTYYNNGAINGEEIRNKIATDPHSGYDSLE